MHILSYTIIYLILFIGTVSKTFAATAAGDPSAYPLAATPSRGADGGEPRNASLFTGASALSDVPTPASATEGGVEVEETSPDAARRRLALQLGPAGDGHEILPDIDDFTNDLEALLDAPIVSISAAGDGHEILPGSDVFTNALDALLAAPRVPISAAGDHESASVASTTRSAVTVRDIIDRQTQMLEVIRTLKAANAAAAAKIADLIGERDAAYAALAAEKARQKDALETLQAALSAAIAKLS